MAAHPQRVFLRHEELDEVTIDSDQTWQTASNFTIEAISVDEIALNHSRSLTERQWL
jgi:hypothetical protein